MGTFPIYGLDVTFMQGISSPVGRVFYYDDRLTTQKKDTA